MCTIDNIFMTVIRKLFRDMVETVAWLHKHKICHMDISLENTMLRLYNNDNEYILNDCEKNLWWVPRAVIIDFGLAIDFNTKNNNNFKFQEWQWHGRRGKSGYTAPEVYHNKVYDCRAVDIWCLGICLFFVRFYCFFVFIVFLFFCFFVFLLFFCFFVFFL